MDFVTHQIAIGGRTDAQNYDHLQSQKITAVLNVAWDLDIVYPSRSPNTHAFVLEYQKVGLIDGPGNRPETLMAAVWMLGQLTERHERILVHCHAGVSRSTTVTALHLATTYGIPFAEGLNWVRKRRPLTDPHRELIQLALLVEKMLKSPRD